MRASKFSDAQKALILRRGVTVVEVARNATYSNRHKQALIRR